MPNQVFRRFVVWCPDWPVVAAATALELTPLAPAAVFDANRVVACSETARSCGVRRGMRRREAQSRCPDLAVCDHDPARDARLFEPVAAAVEALAPGVEIVRPGLVAVPAKGPAGYFGSEADAAERIVDQVSGAVGVECQVGVADGLFAAVLAARRGVLVEVGRSREFLAPLRIEEIGQPVDHSGADAATSALVRERAELVDLLRRLGIRTLGDFAALPSADVATRFGADALLAHRAACGWEERPPERRRPPPELTVTENLDPPVERVDAAAFVAKALAERLHRRLGELGLACTRLGISARTGSSGTSAVLGSSGTSADVGHGEELHRVWRCAEPLTPAGTADRVRWQLDGWLNGRRGVRRPTAGVAVLSLHPEEVVSAGGLQLDLIDSTTGEADGRAGRAFVRVQGMLGPDAVLVGLLGGGRDVRDRVKLVPWGEERRPTLAPDRPWPGRIPPPSPSVVPGSSWPATVFDAHDRPVGITERHELTAVPCRIVGEDGRSRPLSGWAGPWPIEERWWATLPAGQRELAAGMSEGFAGEHRRSILGAPSRVAVRMQVVLEANADAESSRTSAERGSSRTSAERGSSRTSADSDRGELALLLMYEGGRWWVRGMYR
jgi:protein ImuB